MGQEKLYIEKELSWLSFNERVLQEAADKSNPLIERMRFLGIYSNNLDEFYKVRFAELKRRIIISEEQGSTAHSRHLLGKIQARVLKADQEFDSLYNELLLEMARNQIFLINERQLSVNQQAWLRNYFKQYLRQHISPILINRETDLVQFLKDDYTYLAVEIIRGENINYALLEIPSDKVPRFVNLPPEAPRRRKPMILLDNILRYCLDDIFKGFFDYDALNAYSMKMTRDAEYDLVHEMESSLMELMSSSLKQRLTAEPVRFVYQRDMPDAMVEMLRDKLSISNYDSMLPGGRYHNFKDFIGFPNVGKANLVNKPMPRLRHLWFDKFRNGFENIEAYIKAILDQSGIVELQRSQLADTFQVVPSQINYVIKTRFTESRGYLVESKRGGGGYIRIGRIEFSSHHEMLRDLLYSIGDRVSQEIYEDILRLLVEQDLMTKQEMTLLTSVATDRVLGEESSVVRANMLRQLLQEVDRKEK